MINTPCPSLLLKVQSLEETKRLFNQQKVIQSRLVLCWTFTCLFNTYLSHLFSFETELKYCRILGPASEIFVCSVLKLNWNIAEYWDLLQRSLFILLVRYKARGRDNTVGRAPDSWSEGGGFESRQEFSFPELTSCADSYLVSVPSPCYRSHT